MDAWPDLKFPGTVKKITAIAQEVDRRSQRRAFRTVVALEQSDPAPLRGLIRRRHEVLHCKPLA